MKGAELGRPGPGRDVVDVPEPASAHRSLEQEHVQEIRAAAKIAQQQTSEPVPHSGSHLAVDGGTIAP